MHLSIHGRDVGEGGISDLGTYCTPSFRQRTETKGNLRIQADRNTCVSDITATL